MSPLTAAVLLLTAAYLLGAIPFGYLIGRARGIDLFKVGSGNIGATNAARVLGPRFGALVFLLDFLKGALPVALVVPLARAIAPGAETVLGALNVLRVATAGLSFLGHLYPVYLGFRGGKGIATGAGTMFVLVPGPAAFALLAWIAVLFTSRIVSLASLAAATMLVVTRLVATPAPLDSETLPITLYLLAGAAMVFVKHRGNISRLLQCNENRIGDFTMRQPFLRVLHLLALGLWFGGAAFFNFVAAPAIFESFKTVVFTNPSDRTAGVTIIPANDGPVRMEALASALAGSAIGPLFPQLFLMETLCGLIALVTALTWWKSGKLGRSRVIVIGTAVLVVVVDWLISIRVSELRLARFSTDEASASAAKAAFTSWHLVSLALSCVTTCLAGVALAMAARLPQEVRNDPAQDRY
jgi:acyl-phosphate glycerol 3-phosphate acyltransferase